MDLQRAALLYGSDKLRAFADTKVILFGVGGVGSWCAEALTRSGIGHITLVDADVVDPSNVNRQLPCTSLTIGRPKVDVMRQRLIEINPDADIRAICSFYEEANAGEFGVGDYDIVIDAIDSLASKAHLIIQTTSYKDVRLLSSMGAARRIDPSMVKDAEFWKVKGCPLARALRDRFKRSGQMPRRKFRCVYSDEPPKGQPKGTSMPVTATFGLRLAALALNSIEILDT